MPEYPDITVYINRLKNLIIDKKVLKVTVISPFLVRTFDPAISEIVDKKVISINRIGKRIVLEFGNGLFMVVHLMIAGRFQWKEAGAKINRKLDLAHFSFENGTLILTEAATKKRASLHLFKDKSMLSEVNPGGLEVLENDFATFKKVITESNHTIKRSLTDPRILSGIGNAYSDEILHYAGLSPIIQTQKMSEEQIKNLYDSIKFILNFWAEKLEKECKDALPKKVTAFHKDMATHGKFGESCPVCNSKIQRIRYASNETNYCPTCQTGGKLLADRSLSRLLKSDWPKTPEELDELLH